MSKTPAAAAAGSEAAKVTPSGTDEIGGSTSKGDLQTDTSCQNMEILPSDQIGSGKYGKLPLRSGASKAD